MPRRQAVVSTRTSVVSRPATRSSRSTRSSSVRMSNLSRSSGFYSNVSRRPSYVQNPRGFGMFNKIFPPYKLFKLPYVQSVSLAPSGSLVNITGTEQTFCLNGLYDPDITGTGHQPLFRDTLLGATAGNAPYSRYKVIGAFVKLKWYDPTKDGTQCLWRILNPSQVAQSESLTGQDADYSREKLNTESLFLNNSGKQVATRSFYVPMWKVSGLTKLQFNADPDNFTADYSANPGSKIYLQLAAANARDVAGTVACQVEIVYHAVLFGRNTPSTS